MRQAGRAPPRQVSMLTGGSPGRWRQGMVWLALETGKRAACACSSLLLLLPAKGSGVGGLSPQSPAAAFFSSLAALTG